MRYIYVLLLLASPFGASACSCFGPQNFCESVDTSWVEPDVIVLATKLNDVYYGMQVKVLQVFGGTASVGDTLMVWGDNGILCRWYTGAWSVGDTTVFAFHETDFAGNWLTNPNYPANLEQGGDYHISICGLYFLDYSNGYVNGAIDGSTTSLDVASFAAFINTCFVPVSVPEHEELDFLIQSNGDQFQLQLLHAGAEQPTLDLFSVQGKLLTSYTLKQTRSVIPTEGLPKGVYLIRLRMNQAVLSKRFVIE